MGKTFSTGLLTNGVFQDASNNIGIGAAPSGTYKLEVTGTAKVSSTLLVSGASTLTGNVGIGANLLSWYSGGYTALQIGGMAGILSNISNTSTTGSLTMGYNIYVDSAGNYQYMNTTSARAGSIMVMEGGNISFQNAVAATSANPTLTTRFTIASTGAATFSSSVNMGGDLALTPNDSAITFSSGAGRFFTGGAERMRITSGGDMYLTGRSTNGDYGMYFYSNDTDSRIYSSNSGAVSKPLQFYTAGTERLRIFANGRIENFNAPANNYAVTLNGSSTTGQSFGLNVYGGTNSSDETITFRSSSGTVYFKIRGDGLIYAQGIYSNTNSNAANVWVNSDGSLYRSTSSLKYKKNIKNYSKGLLEVIQLRPVIYQGKHAVDGDKQFAGFIAEEIHDLGLTEFVQYAEDGTPDALAYQNMIALLTKAIQEQHQIITSLQDRLDKAGL